MIPQLRYFNLEKNERMLFNNAIEIQANQTAMHFIYLPDTNNNSYEALFFFTKDRIWGHRL